MIQSSRNSESYIRFYRLRFQNWAFGQIPEHLPKGGYDVVSEDGLNKTVKPKYNLTDCKEGWVEIITFSVQSVLNDIIARSDERNTKSKIKSLEQLEFWDDNWIVNTFNYYCYVLREKGLQNTDAYIILQDLVEKSAKKLERQSPSLIQPLKAFKWVGRRLSLVDFLASIKGLAYLFKDGSLEGLKIALSGKELTEDDWGVLKLELPEGLSQPVEAIYLFYQLLENKFIEAEGNKQSLIFDWLTANESSNSYSNLLGKIKDNNLGVAKIKKNTGINYKIEIGRLIKSL